MLVLILNSSIGKVSMMKIVNLNDEVRQYVANLENENESLKQKVNALENVCRTLNYEKTQLEKDKRLADAVRTIMKEWKDYDC